MFVAWHRATQFGLADGWVPEHWRFIKVFSFKKHYGKFGEPKTLVEKMAKTNLTLKESRGKKNLPTKNAENKAGLESA